MGGSSVATKDDYTFTIGNPLAAPDGTPNKYLFEILVKAKSGKTFVPTTEYKYLYTITVKATDSGNNSGTKNAKFYVDNLPPTVTISPVSPVVDVVENTETKEYVNGKIKVSGTASDSGSTGSGLKSIEYEVKKNGASSAVLSGSIDGAPENWEFFIE